MPSFRDIYGSSDFLSAASFPDGQIVTVTIKEMKVETVKEGDKPKLIAYLGNGKKMSVNKTNAEILAKGFGSEDYTTWTGRSFKIIKGQTKFQGQLVPSLMAMV